jgi:uncharacterized Zn ribbon protein
MARYVCCACLPFAADAAIWVGSEKMGGKLSQSGDTVTWTDFNKAHSADNVIAAQFDGVALKAGDKVHFKIDWKSDGASFDSKYWNTSEYQYECAKKDVQMTEASSRPQCLAGTGDFRVFVGDSRGATLKNGFSTSSISEFHGYNFRIFPHASSKAHYYVPADGSPRPGSTVVQTSINIQDHSHENGPFSNNRLFPKSSDEKASAPGGFDLAMGADSYLLVNLERRSDGEVYTYIEMNDADHRHHYTHKVSSEDLAYVPDVVDTIMIDYPNERGYTSLQLRLRSLGAAEAVLV